MTQVEDFVLKQNFVDIPVIVKGVDKNNEEWIENTVIISISQNSRGIILSHSCQIGNLICLEMIEDSDSEIDSKAELEKNKLVWGVVQQSTLVSGKNSIEKYNVGLALIGDKPPLDYFENPRQLFKITGMGWDGFWRVEKTEKGFISRKHPRFLVSFDVFLGILDDSLNLEKGEKVLTENISFGGSAVYSNLELQVGDCVKFITAKFDFSALAIVRSITKIDDKKNKIHIEFIAAKFPVEKIKN